MIRDVLEGVAEVAAEAVEAHSVYTSPIREAPSAGLPAVAVIWANSETTPDGRNLNTRNTATGKLTRAGVVHVHTGDLFVLLSQTGDPVDEEVDILDNVDALMTAFEGDAGLRGTGSADRVKSVVLGRVERYQTTVAGVRYAGIHAPFTATEA